jgi:hypothetical protein
MSRTAEIGRTMKSVSIFFHPGMKEDEGRLHVFAGEDNRHRKSLDSGKTNVGFKYRLLVTANWQRNESE